MSGARQQAPFPTDDKLTAIAIATTNEAMQGLEVLPITPLPSSEYRWLKYPVGENFTFPETLVGRTDTPNEISTSAKEESGITQDYGIRSFIPQRDMERQSESYRPLEHTTELITNLMLLDLEVRIAKLVFDPNLYGATNQEVLTGTAQFSDYTNSDPLSKLLRIMDGRVMRPNKLVMGHGAWSVLRQHPKLVRAFHGNEGGDGLVTRQFFAELLEVEQVLVGKGWVNTARPGQPPNLQRVWGNHILLFYSDRLSGPQNGLSFGWTGQYGDKFAGRIQDPHKGLKGGTIVQTGWEIDPRVAVPDLGYLIQNVVAA